MSFQPRYVILNAEDQHCNVTDDQLNRFIFNSSKSKVIYCCTSSFSKTTRTHYGMKRHSPDQPSHEILQDGC